MSKPRRALTADQIARLREQFIDEPARVMLEAKQLLRTLPFDLDAPRHRAEIVAAMFPRKKADW
jgi:hypothetical protein